MSEVWITKSLQEITTKIGSGATPRGGKKAYKTEGISLIRSLNVHDRSFRTKDLAFIDDKQADQLNNVVIEAGDVLLNITGASIARCCLVPSEFLPARVNQHVSIVRANQKQILPKFLCYLLTSKDYKDQLLDTGEKQGATRQALTKSLIQNFRVTYPESLSEQKRIVAILDEAFGAIARAKENAERNLTNSRELFDSYLNRVFTEKGEGWEESSLVDLCVNDRVITYGVIKLGDAIPDGVPCLRTSNVKKLKIDLSGMKRITDAIADGKQRVLLTMATGTGKTAVAFEIAWKLFQTRWNLKRDGTRRPRILFLADRNVLANQAFNAFSAFQEDALVRISPDEIAKKGKVPTNGSIFFTIFQTFMSGPGETAYFGDYPADYFDLIIIDECHRGGASDESSWRDILEYFSPAVQLGLTATPKRKNNVDTYNYFGKPVYEYSLKEGINDGFLTPFRVKRIKTTLDEYIYSPDDEVIQGEVEQNKQYKEPDFNKVIEIREREAYRVKIFLEEADQSQKAIVFCKTQLHAAVVRDLINQMKDSSDPDYCARVTADDGALGEQALREFQDNEKTIPTVLTTSQKLSTGVDARNVRNIVLMRPVNDMIEFKQIVGRGTRTFEGKDYFTIYDFVNIFDHFADPEWDGDPIDPDTCEKCGSYPCVCEKTPKPCKKCGQRPCVCEKQPCPDCGEIPCKCVKTVKIALGQGKTRQLKHMTETTFWSADGQPVTAETFIQELFGKLPEFYSSEQELRDIWSDPTTRKGLLERLDEAGYSIESLKTLRDLVADPKSDLFDVLEYVSFEVSPITRAERVKAAESVIFASLTPEQREFVEFVLSRYIESGEEVLDREVLPELLKLKYEAIQDAIAALGGADNITSTFVDFQKYLYSVLSA